MKNVQSYKRLDGTIETISIIEHTLTKYMNFGFYNGGCRMRWQFVTSVFAALGALTAALELYTRIFVDHRGIMFVVAQRYDSLRDATFSAVYSIPIIPADFIRRFDSLVLLFFAFVLPTIAKMLTNSAQTAVRASLQSNNSFPLLIRLSAFKVSMVTAYILVVVWSIVPSYERPSVLAHAELIPYVPNILEMFLMAFVPNFLFYYIAAKQDDDVIRNWNEDQRTLLFSGVKWGSAFLVAGLVLSYLGFALLFSIAAIHEDATTFSEVPSLAYTAVSLVFLMCIPIGIVYVSVFFNYGTIRTTLLIFIALGAANLALRIYEL